MNPPYVKEIVYSAEDRDYMMLVNGDCIGFARTQGDAERALDVYVFEMLEHDARLSPASQLVEALAEGRAELLGCWACSRGDAPLCAACQAAEVRELERVAV